MPAWSSSSSSPSSPATVGVMTRNAGVDQDAGSNLAGESGSMRNSHRCLLSGIIYLVAPQLGVLGTARRPCAPCPSLNAPPYRSQGLARQAGLDVMQLAEESIQCRTQQPCRRW